MKSGKPKSLKNQIRDMERLLAKVWEVACSLGAPAEPDSVLMASVVYIELKFYSVRDPGYCRRFRRCRRRRRLCHWPFPACALQPDVDPKMRGRLEGKLEELKAAQAQHQRQELERKYAVRYHKVRLWGADAAGRVGKRGMCVHGACNPVWPAVCMVHAGCRACVGSAAP